MCFGDSQFSYINPGSHSLQIFPSEMAGQLDLLRECANISAFKKSVYLRNWRAIGGGSGNQSNSHNNWATISEEVYSRFDGKLEFVTKLKNDIKVFQWMKIEPADESPANDVPTVDGSAILWDYQVAGVFRFYVLTPFNAIGFTLFSKSLLEN